MSTQAITPPTIVKVGGKPFSIRFSHGAFYLLSSWGIDVTAVVKTLNEYFGSGRYTEAMYKLAAAGLGNFDAEMNWHSLGVAPLDLADRLLDGESGPLIDEAYKAFMGKLGLVTVSAGTEPAKPETPAVDSTNQTGESSGLSEPVNQVSA